LMISAWLPLLLYSMGTLSTVPCASCHGQRCTWSVLAHSNTGLQLCALGRWLRWPPGTLNPLGGRLRHMAGA
jgi:hypothetical protein